MKLLSIDLGGFRGFPKRQRFDLDADAVVVIGANGHGKTSLFDGILWALTGRIPRFRGDDACLISMYSETGQARVELRFKDERRGDEFAITRSFDGKERRVTLETPGKLYQGPSAEGKLIDLVWPDAAAASNPSEALASVLTRSVYLQQDMIRQFVDAETDQDRFTAVSELVGAGRVTELQDSLERSKKSWSTVTNLREDELRSLREKLVMADARLSEMVARSARVPAASILDLWDPWWRDLSQMGLKAIQVESASREAPSAISNAIRDLDALRRSAERRLQTLGSLQNDIQRLASQPTPDVVHLRDDVARLLKDAGDLRRVAADEQGRLAELRRQQAELVEKNEQLKALASLALKHLTDHCPVCAQTYDREGTRKRLQVIAASGMRGAQEPANPNRLKEILSRLAIKEKEVAAAEFALRSGEQAVNERRIAEQSIAKRLSEINLEATGPVFQEPAVAAALRQAETIIRRVSELQKIGESLALSLTQSSSASMLEEFRSETESLRKNLADGEKDVSARIRTGELAQSVIEALREGASAVVHERLIEINPLLQSIWAMIDPHPAFRLVAFLSQMYRGKGQLSTIISDPVQNKRCETPTAVLSSSQVNALAVSVFLALSIGVPQPPMSVVLLDDPLQSLDDINLLGLTDLFRRIKDRRQIVVSTHDERFGSLLCRKLRPINSQGRTIVIELDSWSREGPKVETRSVSCDPVPLRLVS